MKKVHIGLIAGMGGALSLVTAANGSPEPETVIRQILVADFYANCGEEPELADLSIDVALHPNDEGYQRMADELIRAFEKVMK